MINVKFGRRPRGPVNPLVPNMAKLMEGVDVTPPPPERNWLGGMPKSLGMMLNNQLGDCTCAAVYHARQIWSYNTNPPMKTAPDKCVEKLYEEACGYVPGNPNTDNGGVEQDVLTYWLHNGAPIAKGFDKLVAFVEININNQTHMQAGINDSGVVYVGLNIPNYLVDGETIPEIWDVDPSSDNGIAGGHAVVLAGYDTETFSLISWGQVYTMTWRFWQQFGEEAYMLCDGDWIKKSGQTPSWFSLASLEAQMAALKAG